MLVASLALGITSCIVKKDTPFASLIKVLSLACLLGLGLACGNYKNQFSGYTILVLFSVLAMFIATFDFKAYLEKRKEEVESPTPKQEKLFNSKGNLFFGIGTFLSAICLSFAGMYKGYETFYGFAIGVALGLAFTFFSLLVRRRLVSYDIWGLLLSNTAAGLLVAGIITIVTYSVSTTNLIVCIGLALLAVFYIIRSIFKTRFVNLLYYLGTIALFAVLIF